MSMIDGLNELASAEVIEKIIDYLILNDVEKVRRLKWAQENAASHSKLDAIDQMRESINQFAFRNVDGGQRWDPVVSPRTREQ